MLRSGGTAWLAARLAFALARSDRRPSVVLPPVASATAGAGAGLLLAAAFDVAGDGRDVGVLASGGLALLLAGGALRRRVRYRPRLTPTERCSAIVISWMVLLVWSVVVYLATGTFSRVDDALFESVAGLSTTSATVLAPVEEAGDGILVWRASTQWIGGLLGLFLGIIVLPAALGGRELLTRSVDRAPADALAPDARTGMRRIVAVYGGGALLLTALHLVVGLDGLDAFAHALATVSSGGFSTRTGSIAAFDSAALEWLTVAGMLVAGTSLVVLWWVLRGAARSFLRSTELRVYLAMVAGTSALFVVWTTASTHTEVRHAVFTAVSAISTTGYRVTDWDAWASATHGLLITVVSVGAMSCSAGGGLRVVRLLGMTAQLRREVVRQRYPSAVQVARIDGRAVEERTLEQMVGYTFVATLLVVVTSLMVCALGADVVAGVSLSVSSFATFGPGIDAGGAFADARVLPAPARASLLPAMVLGHLAILPPLLVASAGVEELRRALGLRRRVTDLRSRE